ncbi:MAG TPA: type VI secretion protein ImpB, partial [Acholeplasmataceae bacterium]|nr:type VI secretion protein ImpB [Acholeplasmataceae bacterium]
LNYVASEDIHIYSIDEAFLDITHYLKYYGLNEKELAIKILNDIYHETKITATCGIGENMFLAKVALDCLAKHSENNIAYLNQELFHKYIWDIKPLTEIWGIGKNIEKRLKKMNIHTLRDLAHTSLEKLEKEFGIIGKELYEHAHGIDDSIVSEVRNYKPQAKSFGYGQVLFSDYNYHDLYTILLEYIDEIATELVLKKLTCKLISLGIGYSKEVGGGFHRQMTLPIKTNSRTVLRKAFHKLYYDNVQDLPIRRLDIRVGKLDKEDFVQTDLFDKNSKKEHDLFKAIGEIKNKYGKSAINMAISYTDKATKIKRDSLIGGHNAE